MSPHAVVTGTHMGGACSMYGIDEKCIKFLLGKPEGKRTLVRTCRRWEDNIKMDLRELA